MARYVQKSFNGGEISPTIHARNNLQRYENSLSKLKNGFVHAEGCVSNRQGTEFVNYAKFNDRKSRVIPFVFNTEQTYIIELGHKYARFFKDGGRIIYPSNYGVSYEGTFSFIETVQNSDETNVYKYQLGNNDYVYSSKEENSLSIDDILYADVELSNAYCSEEFNLSSKGKITNIDIESHTIGIDVDNSKKDLRGLPVEIETPFEEKDLFKIKFAQNADIITLSCKGYVSQDLIRTSHYDWTLQPLDAKPDIQAPLNVKCTWHGGSESSRTYKYVITAVKNETYEESERSAECSCKGELEANWGVNDYIDVTWDSVEGATEYNIYRSVNGVFGYVGVSTTNSFRDNKIEPDIQATAPIFKNPFENNNNAETTTWFQQRRLFANFEDSPSKYVATQVGTTKNFNISRPLMASDAITITLSDNGVNAIKHLVGMKEKLVIFTTQAVWVAGGSDGTFSANPLPENSIHLYFGSSDVQPVVSGRMILFIQSGGEIVRDLGYTWSSDSYDSAELSIWAKHLFEGKTVIDMAFCDEPYHQLFCIMNDGTMNVLTYDKAQEVAGWGQYTTDGEYESVASIREGKENVAYFIIKRIINGVTKRFIERQPSRIISEVTDTPFVDCSLTYEGELTNHLSGLDYLEGKEISINANGGFYKMTVIDGQVELPIHFTKAIVGIPYEFMLRTLNIEGDNTHGLNKNIAQVDVGVYKSREDFKIITNGNIPYEIQRSDISHEMDEELITDVVRSYPHSDWTEHANVTIIQDKALPLTVTSIATVLDVQTEPTDEQSQ